MAIKTPAENLILLPREVLPHLKGASSDELKALLYFFAEPESSVADAALALGLTVAQTEAAIAFWRGAGIFEESTGKKKAVISDTSPFRNYDSETIANALSSNEGFALICRVAGDSMGKILTKNDHSTLFYLFDYVGIPAEMLCGVIELCCSEGKKNMQYVFKKAIALYEDGIDSYDRFEQYLARREAINSSIGKLRRLCGMGDRALSSNEKKTFDCWFGEWGFSDEMIELAYEKTVDATGKFSIKYMNGILRRWHESGYTTVEDVSNGESGRANGSGGSSFEGDEFIEAALNRGFDD